MLLIIGADFRKLGVYSKSVTKSHYWKFLVSEGIFKLVCYWEKCRWSNISCVSGILVKNIWTDCWIVTVAYLKKQPPEALCKKMCSEKFRKFYRKTTMLESLFKKVAGLRTCNFLKKRLQHRCFSSEISETRLKKVFVNLRKFTRSN